MEDDSDMRFYGDRQAGTFLGRALQDLFDPAAALSWKYIAWSVVLYDRILDVQIIDELFYLLEKQK